jgi:hypothetical protein
MYKLKGQALTCPTTLRPTRNPSATRSSPSAGINIRSGCLRKRPTLEANRVLAVKAKNQKSLGFQKHDLKIQSLAEHNLKIFRF